MNEDRKQVSEVIFTITLSTLVIIIYLTILYTIGISKVESFTKSDYQIYSECSK